MKMKKGYSLVELLIVISILALILVISVPKVLDVIEKIDKTTYQKNVEEMV